MCNILLRDPANNLWQVSVLDQGNLTTSPSTLVSNDPKNPVLVNGTNNWQLGISTHGSLNATLVTPASVKRALSYIPMTSSGGVNFSLKVHDATGVLGVSSTGSLLPDFIPYIPDVAMSRFPVSDGIYCYTCGNASVTVSADLSCWCCTCSNFVLPENTNIIVVLEE